MSRVGKKPVTIPDNITLTYKDRVFTVKGEKGDLRRVVHPLVDLKIADKVLTVEITRADKTSRSLQGLTRSLVANMITGVTRGFERVLEIHGIGYRAEVNGSRVIFNIGYSNPVNFELPEGISATVDRNTIIKLACIDKEKLGQTAAAIRRLRPPEPYKGKGIRYADEYIQKKAGKTGTK